LYGGEDFELVLCMPEALVPEGFKVVGRIVAGTEVKLGDEVLRLDRGFQHF
jgi:thiamine-monophosphate kinase